MNNRIQNLLALVVALTLQLFTPLASAGDIYPEDGWWWNPEAPGRGYFIERQQGVMFVAAFIYSESGVPEWLTAEGTFIPAEGFTGLIGSYTGTVYHSSGGQCIGCDHKEPLSVESVQSPLTISFTDNQNGTMEWSGETIPITRFTWLWHDAVDQLSGTWLFTTVDDGNPLSQFVTIADADDSRMALITNAVSDSEVGAVEMLDGDLILSLTDAGDSVLPLIMPESRRFYAGFSDFNATQVVAVRVDDMPMVFTDSGSGETMAYAVVDTGQLKCYNDSGTEITCPASGTAFYGQDAQFAVNSPNFTDNGDGTVSDNITGLMWQQSPDTDGDTSIDANDKLTYSQAQAYCSNLNLAEYTDWWLPDIKRLYSLINFSGTDPSGYEGSDTSGLIPFIDAVYFDFGYGDSSAGERIIDAQYASNTLYVSNTAHDGGNTMFGVNFADGRIKGYGLTLAGQDKTFYVICVRGNNTYGQNDFVNNSDATITDKATGLMWSQNDSFSSYNWQQALAWVDQQNVANYLGYNDWRLPNAKELQSLVDYTRSPDTSSSAAIDPLFNATSINNEADQADYPAYWTSTTHINWTASPGATGVYVNFGRSMGYMNNSWVDVHGAGAQRSDPKAGDPADFPSGRGPQGDAIRIYNHVRLVRYAN